MKQKFYCTCGLTFDREIELDEHIFRVALEAAATDPDVRVSVAHRPD